MAFSMKDIQKGAIVMPRKVVIYGPPKLGKSTLVGSTKDALLIPTEDRVAHIDCDKTPVVHKYGEILDVFDFLLSDKNTMYKRVIIDSLDWLEPILHQAICEKEGVTSLTDDSSKKTNFARGLKYLAVEGWKNFLKNCDVLREHDIAIIFTAHDQTIKIDPPDNDSYDKAVMKIDKHSLAIVEEWADIIGFYNKKPLVKQESGSVNGAKKGKVIEGRNERILHLSGDSSAYINGNSFGLPDAVVELENCSAIMEWILTESNNNKGE